VPFTSYGSAIKVREYLATGKPVVISPLPEYESMSNVLRIARSREQFLELVDDALREEEPEGFIRSVSNRNVKDTLLNLKFSISKKETKEEEENEVPPNKSPKKKGTRGGGFGYIKDSLEGKNGFVKYWDDVAKSPYIFNAEKKIFISYDDERSIKEKTDYIKKNNLRGAMFWEYEDDPKENLLTVLAKEFGYVK